MKQETNDRLQINKMWLESKGFKKFWRSYLYLVTHPKQCLRSLNFSNKVLVWYEVSHTPTANDDDRFYEPDRSCKTCGIANTCTDHTAELGRDPCPNHISTTVCMMDFVYVSMRPDTKTHCETPDGIVTCDECRYR